MKVSSTLGIKFDFGSGVVLEIHADKMDGRTFVKLVEAMPRVQKLVYQANWAAKKPEVPSEVKELVQS
jgi:hypothetical protein